MCLLFYLITILLCYYIIITFNQVPKFIAQLTAGRKAT